MKSLPRAFSSHDHDAGLALSFRAFLIAHLLAFCFFLRSLVLSRKTARTAKRCRHEALRYAWTER